MQHATSNSRFFCVNDCSVEHRLLAARVARDAHEWEDPHRAEGPTNGRPRQALRGLSHGFFDRAVNDPL